MGNIIDYLKEYSGKTFKQHPFTAVDALLLSQISYMKLENIVPADGFADGFSGAFFSYKLHGLSVCRYGLGLVQY